MFLHNRSNYVYEVKPLVNKMATKGVKKFLSAGEAFLFKPTKGHAEALEYTTDAHEETEGFEKGDISNPDSTAVNEGLWPGVYEDFEVKAMTNSKSYKWFDEPITRHASSIIASLQDTACPLDKPIQFEKTKSYAGRVDGKTITFTTEMDAFGRSVPFNAYKVKFVHDGKCYLHREVATWSPLGEDMMPEWKPSATGHC